MTKEQDHLQRFMFRVHNMRELQKKYFAGNRNVFNDAKKSEVAVDNALKKLCGDLGYSMEDISNKYEQTKLL